MSAASTLLSEDQFMCPICLDVFTAAVSTPCGHNFCKNCITRHWNANVLCECPICKKRFVTRPELQVNMFVSEMVACFRQAAQQSASSSSKQQAAKPGDVPCDVCTGTKLKALKSCLVCLVSFCETHLEPHLTTSGLKKHQLIDPVKSLEGHDVVPLQEEYEGKKAELRKTEAELQRMIEKRQLKIEEFKHSVKDSRGKADKQIAANVQFFTILKETIERKQAEETEMIERKHRVTEKKAEGFIKELEQEIVKLKKRNAELEQLSNSEDHLNFLQNVQILNAVPPTKDWTQVTMRPPLYDGTVPMEQLKLKNLHTEANLKWLRQYAADVTLDPDTAHNELILSEDGKQVHHGDAKANLPDNPERFSTACCVLGKQNVSSGRFYFEVQVKGKSDWFLGVARESVNRKGTCISSPDDGFWTVHLKNGNIFYDLTDPPVHLCLKSKPEKVGVFVDYEEGLVSFYDADAAKRIYTFTGCSFTEKLLPLFSPCFNQAGKNSTPLIICPVNRTKTQNTPAGPRWGTVPASSLRHVGRPAPSRRSSLVAGAYRGRQPDHSFGSEPGRPGEDSVARSHFQHGIVVPGSALRQIEILREKVSFP
ncbi:E3 ubiquitin-protein ligase TRIM21-like [Chaetodon trifascialis]|uniref:E3 ubiquitin-protein ligase TRIM21-like n=1 Tax=Chaetodon trifascialis TaxID=109706 RepID=UPI00399178F3